ncbi:MAG TPA: archease [Planctomycetota bacterium]
MSWTLIDHTGDIGVDVRADSREGLFAEAARAMFDILAEAPAAPRGTSETLAIPEGEDAEALRDFLAELLYRFSMERKMYVGFAAGSGTVEGAWEPYDAARHPLRTELKAVTWHQLEVTRENDGWRARVIFDV